jgi:hypothetical protein
MMDEGGGVFMPLLRKKLYFGGIQIAYSNRPKNKILVEHWG